VKRWLIIATLVLVVLGTLLYTLAGTEPGLRWLAARVASRLPEGSRLDGIRGRLLGLELDPVDVAQGHRRRGGRRGPAGDAEAAG